MHAKKFVKTYQEETHTPCLLSRATDDGQISPVKSQNSVKKGQKGAMHFERVQNLMKQN